MKGCVCVFVVVVVVYVSVTLQRFVNRSDFEYTPTNLGWLGFNMFFFLFLLILARFLSCFV